MAGDPFEDAGLVSPGPPAPDQSAAPAPAPAPAPAQAAPVAPTSQGAPAERDPFEEAGLIPSARPAAPAGLGKPAPAPTPVSTAPPAEKPTPEKPSPQTEPEYKPMMPVTDDSSNIDKMKAFAVNLIPSIWTQTKGVVGAVAHPIDTAKGVWNFGTGINAMIDQAQGKELTPEQKEAMKPVQAYWEQKKDTYGTDLNHFFTAFANNPGEIAMDASVLLTGGESIAGKIPGLARAAKVVGTVGRAVDPLNPAVVAGKAVLGAAGAGAKMVTAGNPGRFLTPGGQLTAAADGALRTASNGTVTAADITDHAAAAAIFAREGKASPEAARAVIMQSAAPGVAPAVPIIKGKLDDPTMHPELQRVTDNNEKLFSQGVQDIAGGATPDHTVLGRALDEAATQSHNAVQAKYGLVSAMDHSLDANALQVHFPGATILPKIEDKLVAGNFLTAGARDPYMALSSGAYPQTMAGIDTIAREMRAGATAAGNVPLRVTERVRQQLNDLFHKADGSDRAGLRAVIDGFDETVEHAASQPRMLLDRTGAVANPAEAAGLVQTMADARAANKAHMNTFLPSSATATTQGVQVGTHTGQLFKAQTPTGTKLRAPSADDTIYKATGKGMNKQLLDATKGPALYDKLKTALQGGDQAGVAGRMQALNTNIKHSLAALPEQALKQHMGPTGLASKVFTPEEISRLRLITASRGFQEALAKKPIKGATKPTILGSMVGPMQRKIIGGILGHMVAPGLVGAASGALLEGLVEYGLTKHAHSKIMRTMREPKAAPGAIRRAVGLATRGTLNAPVTYRRGLAQMNMMGNAVGAYAQKDQGTKHVSADKDPVAYAVKQQETGGEAAHGRDPYKAGNDSGRGASGAYQIMPGTWARLTQKYGIGQQYKLARHAPPAVQDEIFQRDKADFLAHHNNDLRAFFRYWYSGNPAGQMDANALAMNGGQTAEQYADKVTGHMRRFPTTRAAATGGRIERAGGGAVGRKTHEHLVQRLMSAADTARREVNQSTKPLLGMHDSAVAHALEVANRAI
jgi:hypothetical protein